MGETKGGGVGGGGGGKGKFTMKTNKQTNKKQKRKNDLGSASYSVHSYSKIISIGFCFLLYQLQLGF